MDNKPKPKIECVAGAWSGLYVVVVNGMVITGFLSKN